MRNKKKWLLCWILSIFKTIIGVYYRDFKMKKQHNKQMETLLFSTKYTVVKPVEAVVIVAGAGVAAQQRDADKTK